MYGEWIEKCYKMIGQSCILQIKFHSSNVSLLGTPNSVMTTILPEIKGIIKILVMYNVPASLSTIKNQRFELEYFTKF